MTLTARADFQSDYTSNSPLETMRLGEIIASGLRSGDTLALRGGLGSGKTQLVKGIALGLGINEEITSPTYTIISEYNGNMPLYHIDAYRLKGDDDFTETGGKEYFKKDGICVIEWSENINESIPQGAVIIELEITGPAQRRIHIIPKEKK